ncbi:hypothetical protein OW763_14495 [Clostridium aestuarii]|uniref:Lipoprotein n=1 Tax=Clostridium aestuarii TaxID=338193 RepID=A0ABT4D2T4_9CLOT|nr:hypothetical protein [Clostridium aestuarii]MCY6485541.1 hypothetical protein [Clostridium aestuarii]
MKKNLVLILCLSLIFILVGCNSDKKANKSIQSTKISPNEQVVKDKNNVSQKITKVNSKVKLHGGTYFDESYFGDTILKVKNYCEVVISNVTNTSFDFTVYEVDRETENRKLIFFTSTAVFTGDGVKATFYGINNTLHFTFSTVTNIEISGFKPLEGKTYVNNGIAGLKLCEGAYRDERIFGGDPILKVKNYCEVVISNVTNTSFDFTVYEVDRKTENRKVIFLTNTAVFTGDGTEATFHGNNYTLHFTFPDDHGAYPVVTDIKISGFEPLEGKTYVNNGIPGYEFR